jgi:hypothetical protein
VAKPKVATKGKNGVNGAKKGHSKAKVDNKVKNEYGFVKGTRKDMYCRLIKEGTWGKDQILAKVKAQFGTASPNAFSFFLRDCRLKGLKMRRRVILKFK